MDIAISEQYKKWGLLVVWIIGVSCVILFGFHDNPYLQQIHGSQAAHPYPYKQIGKYLLLISIQIMLCWFILRPASYQRSWGRALGAFVLSAGVTFWSAMSMMHASPARIAWYYWLIAVTIGMLVLMLWSLMSRWKKV